jgi:MtN3 and saliva related transmembrane protein
MPAAPIMPDEWLGFVAAALTTIAFVPQAWRTFRTGDVSGISLAMYATFTTGIALWLAYGIRLGAWPLIVANAVTLVLAGAVLVMKIRIDGRNGRER